MMEHKPVYIVDGARTPFLKSMGQPGPFTAGDLAVRASQQLLLRQPFQPTALDEVIIGTVMPNCDEANIGRIVGLRTGCGIDTPGWTVQRNCASGMQSIDSAIKDIQLGRANLVLAGGTEAMSHAPLLAQPAMVNWLARLQQSRSLWSKLRTLSSLKLADLKPVIALLRGLRDPLYGVSMGQTAEVLADQFGVSRAEMDQFAIQSHQKAQSAAADAGPAYRIEMVDAAGRCYQQDTGVRASPDPLKMASLKPFFDRPFGAVTAANSSQISDGAAVLLMASEEAVRRYQLPVLATVHAVQWAALHPEVMGLGPVYATAQLLKHHQLTLSDIDFFEINEAFAAQVLACLRAFESATFCQQSLGLGAAMGAIDPARVNAAGGAIALGHPVGASGTRIVLDLVNTLRRHDAQRGVASICIGGGQGGALLVERGEG